MAVSPASSISWMVVITEVSSSTPPSVVAWPLWVCAWPRGVTGIFRSRQKRITAATSSADVQRATAPGSRSTVRPKSER